MAITCAPIRSPGSLGPRTLIIGNSGSGKSTLGVRLNSFTSIPIVDLDLLHWEDHGYGRKRDEDAARTMLKKIASQETWIIEGVYGWLAAVAIPRTTSLIWLDLPWLLCQAGLVARGPRRGATLQDVAELTDWAEQYWKRTTSSSFAGHAHIYETFSGPKFRLQSHAEIDALLRDVTGP